MFKKLSALLLVAAMTCSLFLGCANDKSVSLEDAKKDTAKFLGSAIVETQSNFFDDDTIPSVIESATKKGSYHTSLDFMGFSFDNMMYLSEEKTAFTDILKANMSGEDIDLSLFINKDDITVDSDSLFKSPMMMAISNIESIFQEQLGYEFDFNAIAESQKAATQFYADALKKLNPYINDLNKKIAEKNVTVNGEKVNAITVDFKLETKDIKELAYIFVDIYSDYLDTYGSMNGSTQLATEEFNAEDIKTSIDESLKDVTINADVSIAVNQKNGRIMLVTANIAPKGDDTLKIDINLGKEFSYKSPVSINAKLEGEDNSQEFNFKTTIKDNNDTYKNTMVMNLNDNGEKTEVFKGVLSYNKDKKSYSFNVNAAEQKATIKGSFKYDKNKVTLAIDGIEMSGMTFACKVLLAAKAEDKMPKAPKDATEYKTLNDLQSITENMDMDKINSLMSLFGYGNTYEDQL